MQMLLDYRSHLSTKSLEISSITIFGDRTTDTPGLWVGENEKPLKHLKFKG